MKKIVLVLIPIIFVGGLLGCYEDKGSYDYHDINEMIVTLSARDQSGRKLEVNEDGQCRYKQPSSTDTMYVTYIPKVSQSLRGDDTTNLEYLWKVSYKRNKESVTDTVNSKELTLKFPPAQVSAYNVILSVTDLSTNISRYRSLSIQTVQPYRNAWFVLNGKEGDRHISTIEDPDSLKYIFTQDAYMDLGYPRRFANAIGLLYSPVLVNYEPTLQIIEKDSIFIMSPFDLKVMGTNKDLLPSEITENKVSLQYGRDGGVQSSQTLLVADNYKLYYYSEKGYKAFVNHKDAYYRCDMLSETNESGALLLYDKEKKTIMYTNSGYEIIPMEDAIFETKTPVWMGQSFLSGKEAVGMILMKDDKGMYYVYDFNQINGYTEYKLGSHLLIDETSQFIANPALTNLGEQFFYTQGSKLYRLNVTSGESVEIYDAGGTISKLKFRVNQMHFIVDTHVYRCLALVVNEMESGELHEVVLTSGGDVDKAETKVFEGFGPIVDICYSFINSIQ